jgi:hypothetical protein
LVALILLAALAVSIACKAIGWAVRLAGRGHTSCTRSRR